MAWQGMLIEEETLVVSDQYKYFPSSCPTTFDISQLYMGSIIATAMHFTWLKLLKLFPCNDGSMGVELVVQPHLCTLAWSCTRSALLLHTQPAMVLSGCNTPSLHSSSGV